jgi:hypothetical protein
MSKRLALEEKRERAVIANAIICAIASHGRRFFSLSADKPGIVEGDRTSYFTVDDRGRVWFTDKWSRKRIYTYNGTWHGFSEGGTLRSVVEMLRDYITGKLDKVDMRYFGPFQEWRCGGDPWGYGADMQKARDEIAEIIKETTCNAS